MSDEAFELSSAHGAENRRETGKPTRADRLAEIGKRTRFKPGQKSANPAGRPRTANTRYGRGSKKIPALCPVQSTC